MSVSRSAPYRSAAHRVLRWCTWYTRLLDPALAGERQDEIASDLHEQGAWADAEGVAPHTAAASILWRAVRGAPADLAWRQAVLQRREQRLDPVVARVRIGGEILSWLTAAIGVGILALGLFVLVRVFRALVIDDINYIPRASIVIAVLLVVSVAGIVLFASPRRRTLGALMLAIPAFGVTTLSAQTLYYISATVTALHSRVPSWTLLIALIGTSLAVVCFATAVMTWRPLARPHLTTSERTTP